MLHELEPRSYGALRKLYQPLWYHLAIFSALEGHSPARVVVDDPLHPTTALLWDRVEGGYYLAGDPDNAAFRQELKHYILDEISPQAQAEGRLLDLVINYAPLAWERTLGDLLAGMHAVRAARQHFLCRSPHLPPWRKEIPAGMEMVTVDADFLRRTSLQHMDHVSEWVRDSWGVEQFVERGIGQCLVQGDTIVSWCIGDYAAGHACEIGIQTDGSYRRRGMATLAVTATLEQCLARGYTEIGWHCWSNNTASAATARKAGFQQTVEHAVYHAWYNAIDNELVQARVYMEGPAENPLQPVDYGAAAAAYRRAFALMAAEPALAARATVWNHPGWRPYLYRSAALAHLHIGDVRAGRNYVELAIESGLPQEQARAILQNEGLASLRDTAAWSDVVAAVALRAAPITAPTR